MAESTFTLPPDASARLFNLPSGNREQWAVIVARKPMIPCPTALLARPGLSAMLTHDDGLSWPDARGEALAVAVMERGGAVMLAFHSLADAIACKRRLEGGTP